MSGWLGMCDRCEHHRQLARRHELRAELMFARQRPAQRKLAEQHRQELARCEAAHAKIDPCANIRPAAMRVDGAKMRGLGLTSSPRVYRRG